MGLAAVLFNEQRYVDEEINYKFYSANAGQQRLEFQNSAKAEVRRTGAHLGCRLTKLMASGGNGYAAA